MIKSSVLIHIKLKSTFLNRFINPSLNTSQILLHLMSVMFRVVRCKWIKTCMISYLQDGKNATRDDTQQSKNGKKGKKGKNKKNGKKE